MTPANHWSVFKCSLARWDVELPTALWGRWGEVVAFADAVIALGRREEVLLLDDVPADVRDRALFGRTPAAARISMYGPVGIEDHVVRDVRTALLAVRPDLSGVPSTAPLAIAGPLVLDQGGPIDISISIDTDLWFPRVLGLHDSGERGDRAGGRPGTDEGSEEGAGGPQLTWHDNLELAIRHTPRLNRFLDGVRDAATALGGAWSYEATGHHLYAPMVDDRGILLE